LTVRGINKTCKGGSSADVRKGELLEKLPHLYIFEHKATVTKLFHARMGMA
jgi:hypothetical protein